MSIHVSPNFIFTAFRVTHEHAIPVRHYLNRDEMLKVWKDCDGYSPEVTPIRAYKGYDVYTDKCGMDVSYSEDNFVNSVYRTSEPVRHVTFVTDNRLTGTCIIVEKDFMSMYTEEEQNAWLERYICHMESSDEKDIALSVDSKLSRTVHGYAVAAISSLVKSICHRNSLVKTMIKDTNITFEQITGYIEDISKVDAHDYARLNLLTTELLARS